MLCTCNLWVLVTYRHSRRRTFRDLLRQNGPDIDSIDDVKTLYFPVYTDPTEGHVSSSSGRSTLSRSVFTPLS